MKDSCKSPEVQNQVINEHNQCFQKKRKQCISFYFINIQPCLVDERKNEGNEKKSNFIFVISCLWWQTEHEEQGERPIGQAIGKFIMKMLFWHMMIVFETIWTMIQQIEIVY